MNPRIQNDYLRKKAEEKILEEFKESLSKESNRALLYMFQSMVISGIQKEIDYETMLITKKEILKRMEKQ